MREQLILMVANPEERHEVTEIDRELENRRSKITRVQRGYDEGAIKELDLKRICDCCVIDGAGNPPFKADSRACPSASDLPHQPSSPRQGR